MAAALPSAWTVSAVGAVLALCVTVSTLLLAVVVPWFGERLWGVLTRKTSGERRFDDEVQASLRRQSVLERNRIESLFVPEIAERRETHTLATRNASMLSAIGASLETQATLVRDIPPAFRELSASVQSLSLSVKQLHDDMHEQQRASALTRENIAHMRGMMDQHYVGEDGQPHPNRRAAARRASDPRAMQAEP